MPTWAIPPGWISKPVSSRKANAVDALRGGIGPSGIPGRSRSISARPPTSTSPSERTWRLTRGILELLAGNGPPADDRHQECADRTRPGPAGRRLRGAIWRRSTSASPHWTQLVSRTLEPRASAPWRRLQAVRKLAGCRRSRGRAGRARHPLHHRRIPRTHHRRRPAQAGAYYASYTVVLRLPWEVRPRLRAMAAGAHFPDRAQRVLHRIEDMRGRQAQRPAFRYAHAGHRHLG